MDYIELRCIPAAGKHSAELLIAKLAEIGFESFIEEENAICAYIPAIRYTNKIRLDLSSSDFSTFILSFESRNIPEENWNAEWESTYQPVLITKDCLVRAPFHQKIDGVRFDIIIEPDMSFGTAHHETTRLMVKYLLEMEIVGKSLLDMGSGTGVLAILSKMKGAAHVLAIDNDERAYQNTIRNADYNNTGQIQVLFGDSGLLKDRYFDVILANINRNILLKDIPIYRRCLLSNGLLILSGFYQEDLPLITAVASEAGLLFLSSTIDQKWTAACYILK